MQFFSKTNSLVFNFNRMYTLNNGAQLLDKTFKSYFCQLGKEFKKTPCRLQNMYFIKDDNNKCLKNINLTKNIFFNYIHIKL